MGPDNPHPIASVWLRTGSALVEYLNPWPPPQTRAEIDTPLDGAKYAACWVYGRVRFLERLAGVTERWDLYAPSIEKANFQVRARLSYDDDSEVIVRQRAEPADFTHFGHWFEERIVNYEYLVIEGDPRSCWGHCNLLAHRYAHNAHGAPLVRIVLFRVEVELAPPGVDAMAHYREQNRLTQTPPRFAGGFGSDFKLAADQVLPDFYEFDPRTMTGWPLDTSNP